MPSTLRTLVVVLAGPLGACLPPPLAECGAGGCTDALEATTIAGPGTPTGSAGSDQLQTVTGDPATTSTSGTTGPEFSTTGSPATPPTITLVQVDPKLIVANGMIEVTVATQNADGVHMQVGDAEIKLQPTGPDSFHGPIAVFSGVDNGEHTAVLTPWRDDLPGAAVEAAYNVQLPGPGSQKFWEAGDLIGAGKVAALGVLPDGLLVELGTFFAGDEPRCYLRRRQLDGTWFDADLIKLLPGSQCTAVDMTIDRELGALHVVLNREGGDGLRWWLGEIASWGKGVKNIGLGDVGDVAEAVAQRSGRVAVCGARPVADGSDAAIWVHEANSPVKKLFYDGPSDLGPQIFAETARDCAFAEDVLVVVGEAYGKLGKPTPKRNNRFVLEHDMITNFDTWTLAGPGPGTQSRALAVAVAGDGRYLVAGSTCGDVCEPDGEIRIYKPGGALDGLIPLGPLNTELAGPHDVAWSPAGQVVVALAEVSGDALRFKVQGYKLDELLPVWTFLPDDVMGLQVAFALAVGDLGEIYAGGIGADNYPAVAYIAG